MKTRLIIAVSLLFFCTFSFAQSESTSTPILKSSDVENFIKNFPDIQDELEELDLDINPQDDMEALTDGLESYEEINSIVKKYGYKDYFDFAAKTSVIAACYGSLKLNEGSNQLEQAYQEIENSESMTSEQKEMAKQMLSSMGGSLLLMANEQDVETVKAYTAQLDKLFEEE